MPDIAARFAELTTPHLADACLRAGVEVRCAPAQIQSLSAGMRLIGRVLPARHVGSVDVFLEARQPGRQGRIRSPVEQHASSRLSVCLLDAPQPRPSGMIR